MDDVYRFFGNGPRLDESVRHEGKTYRLSDAFLETFDFGWSKATTFDHYADRARAMIEVARREPDTKSPTARGCLQAAIVFLISGLETLVAVVLHDRNGIADLPDQALAEYERVLAVFPEYVRLGGPERTAIDRLFKIRHVVVHAGAVCSDKATRALQKSKPRGLLLTFDADDVARVAQACDDLAKRIEKCRTRSP